MGQAKATLVEGNASLTRLQARRKPQRRAVILWTWMPLSPRRPRKADLASAEAEGPPGTGQRGTNESDLKKMDISPITDSIILTRNVEPGQRPWPPR